MMKRYFFRRPFFYVDINLTYWLIGINILFFLLTLIIPPLTYFLAMSPVGVLQGNLWQLVTYAFTHSGFMHLLFNMLGLFFFGLPLEKRLGSYEFLVFYLCAAIGSGLLTTLIHLFSGNNIHLIGASGAVYAVLLGFATEYPRANIYIFGIIPVRAPYMVLGYAAIEIFNQLTNPNSGVAHLAHLFGLLIAFLYYLVRLGVNPIRVFFGRNDSRYWE